LDDDGAIEADADVITVVPNIQFGSTIEGAGGFMKIFIRKQKIIDFIKVPI